MNNPNDPAYPCDVPRIGEEQGEFFTGMTIRQQFVMAAMQGLCANPELTRHPATRMSQWAVEQADVALAEEERTRNKT
jgi:hypothetical protein